MSKSIIINKLCRQLSDGGIEKLEFSEGVNVVTGEPNTGKTTWLRMLDYLLGDKDKVEEAFDSELSSKYESISATVEIGNETLELTRQWNYGYRTKVIVDDEAIHENMFSEVFLRKLDMPVVRYPKGQPRTGRSWPELSWRSLLRHIYRKEGSWGDSLASKQPHSEQHAALTYFLGIAPHLFPSNWEEVVEKRERLRKLKARKEQFMDLVEQFSTDLLPGDDTVQFITAESLNEKIHELEKRRSALEKRKQKVVEEAVENIEEENSEETMFLSQKYALLQEDIEEYEQSEQKIKRRLNELNKLYQQIQNEISGLSKTQDAGSLLADLKITHCPACDQKIGPREVANDECFLCHQDISPSNDSDRLDFEKMQLRQEKKELQELLEKQENELSEVRKQSRNAKDQAKQIHDKLRPTRSRVAALVNTQIGQIDSEIGQISERIHQLRRFLKLLERKEDLSKKTSELKNELAEMEAEVNALRGSADLEGPAEHLTNQMHNYLNKMNSLIDKYNYSEKFKWNHSRISLDIKKGGFKFRVGPEKWSSQLGGTHKIFFLMAYSYALLSLTGREHFFYPGLLLLDFPADTVDQETIGGSENYLVEPFIELCNEIEQPVQTIVAGRSFTGLETSHCHELTTVYQA